MVDQFPSKVPVKPSLPLPEPKVTAIRITNFHSTEPDKAKWVIRETIAVALGKIGDRCSVEPLQELRMILSGKSVLMPEPAHKT